MVIKKQPLKFKTEIWIRLLKEFQQFALFLETPCMGVLRRKLCVLCSSPISNCQSVRSLTSAPLPSVKVISGDTADLEFQIMRSLPVKFQLIYIFAGSDMISEQ